MNTGALRVPLVPLSEETTSYLIVSFAILIDIVSEQSKSLPVYGLLGVDGTGNIAQNDTVDVVSGLIPLKGFTN